MEHSVNPFRLVWVLVVFAFASHQAVNAQVVYVTEWKSQATHSCVCDT